MSAKLARTGRPKIRVATYDGPGADPVMREVDEQSPALHRAMLRYAYAFLAQTTSTALANGRSKIDERLARWLLMAQDRLGGRDTLSDA